MNDNVRVCVWCRSPEHISRDCVKGKEKTSLRIQLMRGLKTLARDLGLIPSGQDLFVVSIVVNRKDIRGIDLSEVTRCGIDSMTQTIRRLNDERNDKYSTTTQSP